MTWWWAAWWAGCAATPEAVAPLVSTGAPVVEGCVEPVALTLGLGEQQVVLLSSGDELLIDQRGGNYFLWHVAGSLRGVGDTVAVSGDVRRVETDEVVASIERGFFGVIEHDAQDCSGTFVGVPAVIALDGVQAQEIPCSLDGDAVRLTVEVEDLGGCDGASCGTDLAQIEGVARADETCP